MKTILMFLGAALFLAGAHSKIFEKSDAGPMSQLVGWLELVGGIAGLVNAAYFIMMKVTAAKRGGDGN